MRVTGAVHTDRGKVRRENQDSYGFHAGLGLYLVADGMGGQAAGKRASEEVARVVADALAASAASGTNGAERLRDAVGRANRHVFELAQATPELRGMGTTVAAVLIVDGMAHVGHVGDSRVYRIRGGRIESLTRDHSFGVELAQRGVTDERMRARYGHMLTRAVGVASEVEVDVTSAPLEPGDVFIICSDGVHRLVDPAELQATVQAGGADLTDVCRAIVSRANTAGGSDNSTIIVLRAEADASEA